MPGKGKYTTYTGVGSDYPSKMVRLSRLFPGNPFDDKNEQEARQFVNTSGEVYLRKSTENGILDVTSADPSIGKIDLKFSGGPNTMPGKDVKWESAGDPAFSYVPDITSPGPGKTEPTDKNIDPQIAPQDIPGEEDWDTSTTTEGTRSPHEAGTAVFDANSLLLDKMQLGKSTPKLLVLRRIFDGKANIRRSASRHQATKTSCRR